MCDFYYYYFYSSCCFNADDYNEVGDDGDDAEDDDGNDDDDVIIVAMKIKAVIYYYNIIYNYYEDLLFRPSVNHIISALSFFDFYVWLVFPHSFPVSRFHFLSLRIASFFLRLFGQESPFS